MKKFEIGKIYSYESGSGIGYDECRYRDYYLITRKNEKSIWWKKISVTTELYSRATNEKADFKKFENAVEKRSKLSIYDNAECFANANDYIFFKYAKEIELN